MKTLALALLAAAALSSVASAVTSVEPANIVQNGNSGAYFFGGFRDFGQSFTADASVISLASIGFYFVDGNTNLATPTVTASLYSGAGYNGPSLGSTTLTIDPKLGDRFVDFGFANTLLVPGASYTMRYVVAASSRGGFGVAGNNPYAGGDLFLNSGVSAGADLRFRVLSSVPEPSTWALLGLGVVGVGVVVIRRRVQA